LKSPIPYAGGKTGFGPTIASQLPAHDHYVEPFCGSLAVLLAKYPSKMETVNDLDQDLMTFWRVLRDQPEALARMCALTPHSRAELAASRDGLAGQASDLERARQVWSVLAQSRTGTLRKTGWRFYCNPAGSTFGMPDYLSAYVDRLAPAAERLAHVSLECRPALEVIADYGNQPEVLLYVDPPYLASTRNSLAYRHEMPSEVEHRELLLMLRACRSAVVLSGYASALYDEMLAGWDRHEFEVWEGQGGRSDRRTEVLWSNRPLARQMDLVETMGHGSHG
jgi:DNA adenine methylase